MLRQVSTGLFAGMLLLTGWTGRPPDSGARATLAGNWTLEMRSIACPQGYAGLEFAADCVDVAPGIAFRVRSERANDWVDFATGDDGYGVVDVTGPGTGHLVMVPGTAGFAQLFASCTRAGGEPIEHEFDTGFLTIGPAGQDAVVSCTWYFVPWEQRDALVTLRAFNCPPGMTVDSLAPNACEAVTTGFEITITSNLGIMEPFMLEDATLDGTAYTWNLGPAPPPVPGGSFELGHMTFRESTLPPGYDDYVIVGPSITGVAFDDGYRIDLSGEHTPADLSLYNFASTQVEEPTEEPAGDPGDDPVELPTQTPNAVESPAAHVHAGTCDQLGLDPYIELRDPASRTGEAEGSSQAVAVASAYSVIDVPLDELLSTDFSIVVHQDGEAHGEDLVCGEIGGVRSSGGALTIGLREVNGSGFVGIAYLSPLPDDDDETKVSLFVAAGLAEDEEPPPDVTPVG